MAVHKRGYTPYDGPRTPERWRFWILTRYALGRAFKSRLLVIFYVLCFIPTVVTLTAVYISHHVDLLLTLLPRSVPAGADIVPVNATLFLGMMSFQATLSVFVTAFIGPGLVSPDLTNNALPLYFSRPFSRAEYIIGKFAALFVVLGMVTTVPMLLIFLMKSVLAGSEWFVQNIHLAFAVTVGTLVWVTLLSLVSMASSAWLRWRPAAAGMLFALFFFPTGFGQAANLIMRTGWGNLLNGIIVIGTIWNSLFFINDPDGYPRAANALNPSFRWMDPIPAWSAWMVVAAVCGISLLLLDRKIRAHEVVR
jgi:ABC-2 type transport system permease protein